MSKLPDITVTIVLFGDDEKVQISATDVGIGLSRNETYTDDKIVMAVYQLMGMLLDIVEDRTPYRESNN